MARISILDCEEGRRRGCSTFCCRLIVRLEKGERDPGQPENAAKHCVDKDPDGLCTYLDRENHRCSVWEKRPNICRAYDCNEDPLLQIVLRDGYYSLIQLVTTPPPTPAPGWSQVPSLDVPGEGTQDPLHDF